MILACSPYCSNEYAMNADLVLLEVSPAEAGRLLETMERCRVFLREMTEAGLAGRNHGHVAFPSSIRFRLFGTLPALWEASLDQMDEEDWLALVDKDATSAKLLNDAIETELECHQLLAYENFVCIAALSRYGSDRFETRSLPRTMIEEIAQGRSPTNAVIINGGTPHGLRVDV